MPITAVFVPAAELPYHVLTASQGCIKPIILVLLLQPLNSGGVAKVVSSNNSSFKEGDIVSGLLQWASYTLVPKGEGLTKIDPSAGAPLAYYLGVLGESM